MSTTNNILSFRNAGSSPDEVEVLLRNFFRAEMPQPWPAMKAPAPKPSLRPASAPAKHWTPVRSRLALAASVGFLMVGSWCLSAKLPEYANVNQDSAGDGTDRGFLRGVNRSVPVKNTDPSKTKCSGGCCDIPGK